MNLAFILQSFGIKLTEQEVATITDTIKTAPELLSGVVNRVAEIERKVNFLYDMQLAAHAPRDQVEAEFQRQLALSFEGQTDERNQDQSRSGGTADGSAAIAAE